MLRKKIFEKLGLGLFLSLFIVQIANAAPACEICSCFALDIGCWLSCIGTYLLTIPLRVVLFIIAIIGYGLGYLILFVGMGIIPGIVSDVINISLSFDYGSVPEAIAGWGAVKEISLSLVYILLLIIGLATIFRIAEYQARKTLVALIVAALLVHFSFAISTKVVQIGNEFSKAIKRGLEERLGLQTSSSDFLNASSTFSGLLEVLNNSILPTLGNIFCYDGNWWAFFSTTETNAGVKGPVIPKLLLITLLSWIIASVVFFIFSCYITFGMMFLMRTVFFVGLIIISPIAFLTAALRTKEIQRIFPGFLNWDGWWTTFLEWSFVGVNLVIWLTVAALITKIGGKLFVSNPVANLDAIKGTISNVANMSTEDALNALRDPMTQLILYLIPVLGGAAPLFFASVTSPKLGQQFAAGAFKFLNQVGSAIMTGGAIAIGAFTGAAAGAAVSGAKAIREAKGAGGKLKAFGKTALNVPTRGFGALAKEGVTGGLRAAITPLPPEVRKEMITAWRRRVSGEEAKKYVEDVEKKKGPKGVQDVVENKFKTHSDLERMEGIKKAIEGGYYKKEWAKEEGIKRLTLRVYEEAAKRDDKKSMGMMERRLVASLGEEFIKRKIEIGKYTEKDIDEDVKNRVFTQEQGKLMKELMEKVKRKEKLSAEEEKALKDLNITKVIAGVKTADDIKQLEKGVIHEEAAMTAMQKFWTGAQWGAAAREFGKELVDALEPLINQLRTFRETNNVEGYLHFVWDRPGLARFSETAAAQEVGFPSWYEFAPEAVKSRYRNMREILAEKPPPRS